MNYNFEARKKKALRSIRYCLKCEENTTFEYDSNIGHSVCMECGGFRATKPKQKGTKR